MGRGKVWTITDGRRKLRPGFLDFSLGCQFNPEQMACLPEPRFELNDHSKSFNRPCPQTQRTEVNRLVKIIRRALWLKAGGALIIDRSLFQISPVLLQKSQVNP